MTATVTVDVVDHIATVTLNRPEVANTMDLAFGRDLLVAARRCEAERVRAVILTGAGKAFCFGGDLKGMMGEGNVEAYLLELTRDLHAAIEVFTSLEAPVIAAVNGTAAGAGIGLVAMADLSIAAEGAKFSMAYTAVGLTPDGSTSYFVPRAIGYKRAMELLLTNRQLTAAEACAWGLVNQVVPDAELMETVRKLAARLAAGPTGSYGHVKRLLAASEHRSLPEQLADESRTIARQAEGPEGREGITAFLEKRKASYSR